MSHRSVRRAHRRRLEAAARREARLRRLGLSAGAVVASTAFAASSAQAATFQVTSTADAAADACDVAGTGNGCTLRDAVTAANAAEGADVITFASDVTGVIRLTEIDPGSGSDELRQLRVAPGGLTITGPGAGDLTVSGDSDDDGVRDQGDSRHFTVVDGAALELSGLTLTEGVARESDDWKYSGGGGSIAVRSGGTLDLHDAAITASTSDNVGGALLLSGTATIARTTFAGNSARVGGAITQTGAGVGVEDRPGSLTIEDSAFSGNAATRGGAISTSKYGNVASSSLTVTGTTFGGNTASFAGGAIDTPGVGMDGPLTIRESLFTGNTAGSPEVDGAGGAIALSGSQNTALPETDDRGTVTLDRNTFSGNTASGDGGALLLDRSPEGETVLTRSTLFGNRAERGAGISIGGVDQSVITRAAAPTTTGVTLDALTISGNVAATRGGGVFAEGRPIYDPETETTTVVPSTQVISSSILAGNTADEAPGDLGQDPAATEEDVDGGFVLRHSLVQAPAGAQFVTDAERPSLIGVDPLLQALALTGGRTPTMLPAAGSPAVDAGDAADGVEVDQRGLARTVDQPEVADATGGDGTDIGAVERAAPAAPAPPAPQPAAPAAPVAPASVPAPQLPAPGTSTLGLPPAPISRPSVVRKPRQPITLRGTAGRGTTKVRVSLARKVGKQCKFLLSTKKFSARRDCRRTMYVTAQGTTSWRLTLPVLSKGKYTIWSRAIVNGRIEKKKTTQNFRRFEIR